MQTRTEVRSVAVAYVCAVLAIVGWPDRTGWTNGTVIAIGLGGFVAGWLLWTVVAERRVPWHRRPHEQPSLRGASVMALVVGFLAFLVLEALRGVWPPQLEVYLDPPVTTVSADGSVRTTYVDWIDLPLNEARRLIVYFGLLFGGLILGDALVRAIHAWRGRRAEPVR